MVTYQAVNMAIQLCVLFVITITAIVAIITLVTNRKEK
ncbi:putative holin-like toxin [Anaerobacillus isosaccharinicus]